MIKQKKPTARNLAVADYMRDFLKNEDRLPVMSEIQKHFEFSSPNAAVTHIKRLVAHDVIEPRGRGHYRFKRQKSGATNASNS
jgi:SOS-response transcriptional repressor LexA